MPSICCFWTTSPGHFLCQTEQENPHHLRKAPATKPRSFMSPCERVHGPISTPSFCSLAACVRREKFSNLSLHRKQGQESSRCTAPCVHINTLHSVVGRHLLRALTLESLSVDTALNAAWSKHNQFRFKLAI